MLLAVEEAGPLRKLRWKPRWKARRETKPEAQSDAKSDAAAASSETPAADGGMPRPQPRRPAGMDGWRPGMGGPGGRRGAGPRPPELEI